MSKTIRLNNVALRIPADANVLIPVCGDDVFFVLCKEEGCEEGGVTKDKLATGSVLMRGEFVLLSLKIGRGRSRGMERVGEDIAKFVGDNDCLTVLTKFDGRRFLGSFTIALV